MRCGPGCIWKAHEREKLLSGRSSLLGATSVKRSLVPPSRRDSASICPPCARRWFVRSTNQLPFPALSSWRMAGTAFEPFLRKCRSRCHPPESCPGRHLPPCVEIDRSRLLESSIASIALRIRLTGTRWTWTLSASTRSTCGSRSNDMRTSFSFALTSCRSHFAHGSQPRGLDELRL